MNAIVNALKDLLDRPTISEDQCSKAIRIIKNLLNSSPNIMEKAYISSPENSNRIYDEIVILAKTNSNASSNNFFRAHYNPFFYSIIAASLITYILNIVCFSSNTSLSIGIMLVTLAAIVALNYASDLPLTTGL